jgi:hypothetical protein
VSPDTAAALGAYRATASTNETMSTRPPRGTVNESVLQARNYVAPSVRCAKPL